MINQSELKQKLNNSFSLYVKKKIQKLPICSNKQHMTKTHFTIS